MSHLSALSDVIKGQIRDYICRAMKFKTLSCNKEDRLNVYQLHPQSAVKKIKCTRTDVSGICS